LEEANVPVTPTVPHIEKRGAGLRIARTFSVEDLDPYATVTWSRRDVVAGGWRGDAGPVRLEGVEFPSSWSDAAVLTVASRYLLRDPRSGEREHSLRQSIDRVVSAYVDEGERCGYFTGPRDAGIFKDELTAALVHQLMCFSSPTWFNVGTGRSAQVNACFVLRVEDDLGSVRQWLGDEASIFVTGGGLGLNLSSIRSSKEQLSSGVPAQGPLAFMRAADAAAGAIRSGGALRRPARMMILNVDHPDIEEFVESKAREQRKAEVLQSAGYDLDFEGDDTPSLQFQNSNHSVRVGDDFMRAALEGGDFPLRYPTNGEVYKVIPARDLLRRIAHATWLCGDPGLHFDDTINSWNTTPELGRLTASNGCSEYLGPDNTAASVMSLNLMSFLDPAGMFEVERFVRAVELATTALDVGTAFTAYPTEASGVNSRDLRPIGVGYANLGGLLVAIAMPYDSPEARTLAAAITSLMSAVAYRRSAELARTHGPYPRYEQCARSHHRVVRRHVDSHAALESSPPEAAAGIVSMASEIWHDAVTLGRQYGWRNSHVTLVPPTGTVSLMMDCATTGVEPFFTLSSAKKLVGGMVVHPPNGVVGAALDRLGYGAKERATIVRHIAGNETMAGAPELRPEHLPVFASAAGDPVVSVEGHVDMVAAIQPFLSGGVSKTVNLPEKATVEDVERALLRAWRGGVKVISVYRENSKAGQPIQGRDARAGR
jgi:ribonucleoside-diphosphate reductase alpha chain